MEKKPLKICMIIDAWYPVFGGGQVHVENLCKYLIKNHNCEVDLFVRSLKDIDGKKHVENERHYDGKMRIFRVGPSGKFFNPFLRILCLITTTWAIYWKARKNKYDLIHAHAFISGIPGKIIDKIFKIPIVYTVHGFNNLETGKKGLIPFVEKFILTKIRYDKVISVGKGFLKYPNVNRDIVAIPNGVYVEDFDMIRVKKCNFFKMIFVGRLSWPKGLSYLLEAFNIISEKNPDLLENKELHIIGDGELKDMTRELIEKYKLNDYVKLRGAIFDEQLVREYKSSDLFILSSVTEGGQPITLLEAFAAKLPVVSTEVGDAKYLIKNGISGFIVTHSDAKALSFALMKILKLPQRELLKMGEFNYNLVKDNFTWCRMAQNTYKQYLTIIK